jgi:hypothetical protein
MEEKLTERTDLRGVRLRLSTRAKLNVVRRIRRRKLSEQIREAIERGVDQEFAEHGKEAIEMLCREMSAIDSAPPARGPMSVNVGDRRQMSAEKAS